MFPMEGARKMNYFGIPSHPVAAGWGETAEHVPVLAAFQHHYRKRFLQQARHPRTEVESTQRKANRPCLVF